MHCHPPKKPPDHAPDLLQWRACALYPAGPAPSPAGGIFLRLEAADGVARYRGMERSEYIRHLIEEDIPKARQGYEALASIFGQPKTGS